MSRHGQNFWRSRFLAKATTRFVCQQCGHVEPKWAGRCPSCSEWNSLVEEAVREAKTLTAQIRAGGSAFSHMGAAQSRPRAITEIEISERERQSTFIPEFDRVLGGGIVPGSLTLIGGEPGIGKSTLMSMLCGNLAAQYGTTLYISGEESVEQIKLRAVRLSALHKDLLLASETDIGVIASFVEQLRPKYLVIDSIQTMISPDVDSAPGTVSQVRAATSALAALAKGKRIPIFLVGHVTKEGAIAGPRVLEHMVDTVLYFEGDAHLTYRILRAVKNRFGSTDELGIFEMRSEGLVGVENPSAAFLAERPIGSPGSTVTATMEGSRALLVEVQALVAQSYLTSPRRVTNGVHRDRVALVLAVLEKRLGLSLANMDVFVSVAGGVRVEEPSADLAIALAVAGSFLDRPVGGNHVFLGEIGLAGEVRSCTQIEKRLREAAGLGFGGAILPQKNIGRETQGIGLDLSGVETVRQAVEKALLAPQTNAPVKNTREE